MCGIFGYVGPGNAVDLCLQGLKKLEYRGYDSAGIAGIHGDCIGYCKVVGNIDALAQELNGSELNLDTAIAQTRWATHGKPSIENAHPHFDNEETLAVVHNGIIENHEALRHMLKEKGFIFQSETDSEVIAHLIAYFYEGDILRAVQQALPLLQGAFALAIIHKQFPGQIIAVASESPLAVGIGAGEAFIASDSLALRTVAKEVIYLADCEVAVVRADQIETFDASMSKIIKTRELVASHAEEITKNGYEHFTLKEIFEQSRSLHNAINNRFILDYGTADLEGLGMEVSELLAVQRILILACGTSWNAGYVASYMLEDWARIPVQVEISSEFRYKNPIVPPGTLVIAISQSGETADTLAAVRELKAKGAKILAICNVHSSSLTREASGTLFLRAGPEIGVCSTKAFTSMVAVLALFSLMMARMRNVDQAKGQEFLSAMKKLPQQVQTILDSAENIQAIAKKYAKYDNFFFIGRKYMFPTALEGALKLKEISYINANGYPAGEMKHGPIALISDQCPTVALCANEATLVKILSNLMEIKARNGLLIAIAEKGMKGIDTIADEVIWIPPTIDELAAIPVTVVTQLLAYYIAHERGTNIDQPRNLAKSVTVE